MWGKLAGIVMNAILAAAALLMSRALIDRAERQENEKTQNMWGYLAVGFLICGAAYLAVILLIIFSFIQY